MVTNEKIDAWTVAIAAQNTLLVSLSKRCEEIEQSQGKLEPNIGKFMADVAGELIALRAQLTTLTVSCAALNGNHSGLSGKLNELDAKLCATGDGLSSVIAENTSGLVDEIRQCFLAGQITKAARPRKRKRKVKR